MSADRCSWPVVEQKVQQRYASGVQSKQGREERDGVKKETVDLWNGNPVKPDPLPVLPLLFKVIAFLLHATLDSMNIATTSSLL